MTRSGQASGSSGPQPMDVDSITQWIASLVKGQAKGKGKGKSKGKEKGKGKGKGTVVKAQMAQIQTETRT